MQQQQQPITHFQSDKSHFRTLLQNFGHILVFIFFSQSNQQSLNLLADLTNSIQIFGIYPNVKYFAISAQKCPQTFQKYGVQRTPTIIFTETSKKIYYRHEDESIGMLFDELSGCARKKEEEFQKLRPVFYRKCGELIDGVPLMIFMKGTPTQPKCGFIRQLVEILTQNNMEYAFYNIQADDEIRHWLRLYKGHPTYPQIFLEGKFLGGLDSLRQIIAQDKLHTVFPAFCFKSTAEERLQKYLKYHEDHRIVFIDGFAFESEVSEKFMEKNCQGKEGEFIWNVGLDREFREVVQKKFQRSVPFVVEKGSLVE